MALGKGPGLAAKAPPKPNLNVVTEAHNLLLILGDPKRVKETFAKKRRSYTEKKRG